MRSTTATSPARSTVRRPPPLLYRLAEGLRTASILLLVLLILFAGSVAYSAVETARSGSRLGPLSVSFLPNGTAQLAGTLTLGNGGIYPVRGLTIAVRVSNASGIVVGTARLGPVDLGAGASEAVPLQLDVAVSGSGPGPSLLTRDQSLPVVVWANATLGYLFPVSLLDRSNRSWGAPFADLAVSVGAPTASAGTVTVAVTLSFQNDATFGETGTIPFSILAADGAACGAGQFVVNVPPGSPYSETVPVDLSSGCSPVGGTVSASYVTASYTLPLPPEPIP